MMKKKEAILAMLDGKKVINNDAKNGCYLCYEEGSFRNNAGEEREINGEYGEDWELYEEPVKEEAPEHIDIEVTRPVGLSLSVDIDKVIWNLGAVIGTCIERHDTRYFATWYMIDGEESSRACIDIGFGLDISMTFADHVRFVREDLLGGIPE